MTAHIMARKDARCINHIRLGETYLATTRAGFSIGEYMGIEVPHGDRSILLRNSRGTESIDLDSVLSIQLIAA